ncbi:MAG: hypothetical protein KGZ40_06025 [Clostridiales bacterium]|nr:hypothetical protein [Clostridiales bacterium]
MWEVFGAVVTLVLGALAGVIATSLVQDRIDSVLSSFDTGAFITGQDLRGNWDFEYLIHHDEGNHAERAMMRTVQVGNRVRGICEPTSPGGFCLKVRGVLRGATITGSWTDMDPGSRMSGAFFLHLNADGSAMVGNWLGPHQGEGEPRVGSLELTRIA